jgi:hypothetical protein
MRAMSNNVFIDMGLANVEKLELKTRKQATINQ